MLKLLVKKQQKKVFSFVIQIPKVLENSQILASLLPNVTIKVQLFV